MRTQFPTQLIISNNHSDTVSYLKKILLDLKIHAVDQLWLEETGIDEVRQTINFLSRKPFASLFIAIIISGNKITYEAQQALLKTLEEPPQFARIFLYAYSAEKLLPTIVSRTFITCIVSEKNEQQSTDESDLTKFWQDAAKQSLGKRLETSTHTTPKERKDAFTWVDNQIKFFRGQLLNAYSAKETANFEWKFIYKTLKELIKTSKYLEANLSLKLSFDHLFLNLPSTKR